MKFFSALASLYLAAYTGAEVIQFKITAGSRCMSASAGGYVAFVANTATVDMLLCRSSLTTFSLDTYTGELLLDDKVVGFDANNLSVVAGIQARGQFFLDKGALKTQALGMGLRVFGSNLMQMSGSSSGVAVSLLTKDQNELTRLNALVTAPKRFKLRVIVNNGTHVYYRCATTLNSGFIGFQAQTAAQDQINCQITNAATTFTFHPDSGQLEFGNTLIGFRQSGIVLPGVPVSFLMAKNPTVAATFRLNNGALEMNNPAGTLQVSNGFIQNNGVVPTSATFNNLQFF